MSSISILRLLSALAMPPVLLGGLAVSVLAAHAQETSDVTSPSDEARQLLDLTNQARDSQGLAPLRWDTSLAAAAEQHNQLMRSRPELMHQYPDEPVLVDRAARAGAHFSSVAENIAMGPSVAAIEREWLHSVPHRANIFDPKMNSIGIAVVRRGGDFFATEDFAQAVQNFSPAEAEAQVIALLREQGITVDGSEAAVLEARQTCEMNTGLAGDRQPHSVIRWETSSLTTLPPQVTDRTSTSQYKSAAVGACTSLHPQQGFTTYRFALLLF